MALTGLQIQKLLPKTNCKECGSNTCMAFAMKLAAKKAELTQCPYASEEARRVLGAAAEPPVRGIALGPDRALRLGEETVLYRHEKTFVRQTALAVNVNDADLPDSADTVLTGVAEYVMARVGEQLRVDMVAVTHTGGSSERFLALARAASERTGRPLVLRSPEPDTLCRAAEALSGRGAVLCTATPETAPRLAACAAKHGHALAVTAPDLDTLHATVSALQDGGFRDVLLQFDAQSPGEAFQSATVARRAALKDSVKALGYPHLRFVEEQDLFAAAGAAVGEIAKYGGVCVLPAFDRALLATLLTVRQNIYTDPQKPIQVEPRVYPVGEPGSDSPVYVTTNFSLTYFIVSGEIENSGTSGWLVVPECEGMSVLTAWAAGKFSAERIAKFVKEAGLAEKVRTREIVIPGYVAQMSGELEEQLPGWKAVVGPQEASDIEGFVKSRNR